MVIQYFLSKEGCVIFLSFVTKLVHAICVNQLLQITDNFNFDSQTAPSRCIFSKISLFIFSSNWSCQTQQQNRCIFTSSFIPRFFTIFLVKLQQRNNICLFTLNAHSFSNWVAYVIICLISRNLSKLRKMMNFKF